MSDLAETQPEVADTAWAETQIGRYKLLRLVGTGGMGVVVAAHDPELDREVAIKIVAGDEAARPIREAQAMAKLSHPNVVQVYEVVRLGARTAIVMELVAGMELGAWVKDRPWREVVDAYAQACRGLAAAHRANIVHRDFKPSNALVDQDGVVRVTDFGLAHPAKDTPLDSAGTPAYMAPEQHSRGDVDARTDQWSLACSLYEALYGRRPFAGSTRSELAASVTRGEIAAEPSDSPVPRYVRAAVRRGLAIDPKARFETIEELAAAITSRPRAKQYTLAAALAGAVVIALVVLARRGGDAPQCQDLDTPITAVWSPTTRGDLRARLLAKDVGLPEATADRALNGLDAYASSWTSTRLRACLDTSQGVRSTETLDTRMRCLDHGLASLTGLLEGLATGDRAALHAANDAVAQLPPPAACAEASGEKAFDPAFQRALDEGEDLLARATAARSLSQYERAITLADRAIIAATLAKAPSLVGRALIVRGLSQVRLGHNQDGLVTLQRAAKEAARARDLVAVAEALVWGFHVEGEGLGRRNQALQARPYIDLAVEVAGQPDHVRAGWLHELAIILYRDRSQLAVAAEYERKALAIRQRTLPPGHVFILDSMETLGHIEASLENFDEAIRLHTQLLEGRIASRGPSDYTVGWAYNDLGADEILRNNLLPALDYLQRSVEIAAAAGKSNQHAVFNLGLTQLELGRWAACETTFRKALELAEATSKESVDVADSSSFAGLCGFLRGDVERARPLLLRGAELSRREGSTSSATALSHAALLALHDGDKARARALVDQAAKSPNSGNAVPRMVAAVVVDVERGCATSRPVLQRVFDSAVETGDRSVQTLVTAPLAACEIAAGDLDSARKRLDFELAWQAKMGSDAVAGAPLRAALAKLR